MLTSLLTKIPEYAHDTKANMSAIIDNHNGLNETQFWGSVLAAALATKNKSLIDAIQAEKTDIFTTDVLYGINSAFTLMSMTNIYYRFAHLSTNNKYLTMNTGFIMNAMKNPRIEKIDFEIFSLAVSIVGGCGICISAHEKQLLKHGFSEDTIQLIAKIAAIIHSLASIEENK